MRTLHASGHWQTSNADLRAWVAEQIAAHAPRYLTHTEAGRHRSALTLHDGYGVIHPRGDEGQAECAIQYRLDGPRLLSSRAVRLSSLPIPRRSGDFCYATYAEFADHHHLAIHLPSGVEGAFGFSDEHPAQVDCYRDAIGGLRRFVAGLDDRPVVIVGDWNLDPRLPWVAEYLELHFPDFALNVPAVGGTHGKRFIDFSLVRGYLVRTERVMNTPTSDHDALLERITPKEITVSWRVAVSLETLRAEINKAAPRRSVLSDGGIGDAAHASRDSDHNPWVKDSNGVGVVRARDFTHDPANGIDCNKLAERLAALLKAGTHPALGSGAYVIWNRRIISRNRISEGWRAYTGSNPHDKHLHLSVALAASGYDSAKAWGVMAAPVPPPAPLEPTRVTDARALLVEAVKRAGPRRKARLLAALALLPKR